jgi:tRNA-Thr(GGU) m(6)t(6)A37 methyltransferase TsaA
MAHVQDETRTFQIHPIGAVRRQDGRVTIAIDDAYRPALQGLQTFSHVIVTWWAERFDSDEYRQVLVTPLPYAEGRESGVFANRAPVRPNLIMSTVCKIVDVDAETGAVTVGDIDAFDGTPVVDLKAYFPVMDRVGEAHISDYLQGWPEWVPDEGIGLMPGEG